VKTLAANDISNGLAPVDGLLGNDLARQGGEPIDDRAVPFLERTANDEDEFAIRGRIAATDHHAFDSGEFELSPKNLSVFGQRRGDGDQLRRAREEAAGDRGGPTELLPHRLHQGAGPIQREGVNLLADRDHRIQLIVNALKVLDSFLGAHVARVTRKDDLRASVFDGDVARLRNVLFCRLAHLFYLLFLFLSGAVVITALNSRRFNRLHKCIPCFKEGFLEEVATPFLRDGAPKLVECAEEARGGRKQLGGGGCQFLGHAFLFQPHHVSNPSASVLDDPRSIAPRDKPAVSGLDLEGASNCFGLHGSTPSFRPREIMSGGRGSRSMTSLSA
jgi:hypothetical protein